jgi:23S rRNA (guanosine2251-2'-O)-methyltransferase
LDQLSDVRNFGAIVRTAECTGVDCIIIQSSGSAPVNGDAIKTSSGAVFNVPICKVSHIKDAIFLLKQLNVKIYGASEKADNNIFQTKFKNSQALVMGSEGKGLSNAVINLCDELVKIPLEGKIESLNVSVACGTILYEILRQKKFNS